MKKTNPFRKIGASLLITVGLIGLTYLLLPKELSIGASPNPRPAGSRSTAAAIRADQKQARMALGQLPLSFEMNRGQFPAEVQFSSRGAGYKAFFAQGETVFVLRKPVENSAQIAAEEKQAINKINHSPRKEAMAELKRLNELKAARAAAAKSVVRMTLVDANPSAQFSGLDELPGKINYFRGKDSTKWINNVPTFRRVAQNGVYPGIDLVYYGKGRDLEYDLVVAAGADPSRISFNFEGADRVEVDGSGGLVVSAAGAQLHQGKPLIYQDVNGSRRAVSGSFTTQGNRAGFSIGDYDKSRPLIIDPIFTYVTYLAGEDNDRGHAIAGDPDGNAYIAGWTQSEEFPTKNAYQSGNNSDSDEAFVTKLNPDGTQLIWSTYLGGGASNDPCGECGPRPSEGAFGVAIDSARNVYVTGFTFSNDFPTYLAMQPQLSDARSEECDSFITKIATNGDRLVFSTYFGGVSGTDVGRGIAVDSSNNVYVTGYTNSYAFPTTNPIQGQIDGRTTRSSQQDDHYDAYLAKIDASGQFRVYSTYLGGDQDDVATGIAVDQNGAAYITGWTDSTFADASATPEPNRIQEFDIPQPFERAGFIAVGPDSQIWFGDIESQIPGRMGRLNIQADPTATPTFDIFTFDPAEDFSGCQVVGDLTTLQPGPTGTPSAYIYFNDYCNNRIGQMDASGNAFQTSSGFGGCAAHITSNPDGHLYSTDSCNAQFFRDDNAQIGTICGNTYGITTGPNGHLYIIDGCGFIEEWAPSATGADFVTFFTSPGVSVNRFATIVTGPDGNLYFTTDADQSPFIGRFNPSTGETTLFNTHTGFSAQGITAGPDGNIYFVVSRNSSIGRLELATGTVRNFGLPSCNADPRDITAGPDGNLYFTEANTDKIGRYKLNPLTPEPPATPTPCPITHVLFPTTPGAYSANPPANGFTRDSFVTKVDPAGAQILYSSFLGGAGEDTAWGIAVGSDRSAFVTGYTDSGATPAPTSPPMGPNRGPVLAATPTGFPTTANAYQPQNAGGYDAFLTRFSPDGSTLVYSTYIGGSQDEGEGDGECLSCASRYDGGGIAVDFANRAYITGWTESTFVESPSPTATATTTPGDGANAPTGFPTPTPVNFPTKDAAQPSPGSQPQTSGSEARDAFISKFNTDASGEASLVYSTFLGGSRQDEGQAIAVDPAANTYVTGWTQSGVFCECCECSAADRLIHGLSFGANDFPTTVGAFQEEPGDSDDAWVAKLAGGTIDIIGQGQGYMISGMVTLADDGSPLAGITITLTKPDNSTATTMTDATGIYSFPNLPPVPESPYTVTPSGGPYTYDPPQRQVIITNSNQRADFVASIPESPTPTATATATATATVSPASQTVNLSTRLHVLTGDQVGIGGFIITGSGPKHVIVRAIGPDLRRFGIPNPLEDPVLELHGPGAFPTITNNNWRDTQQNEIKNTGLAPTNDLEAAIDAVLSPGNYTGIIRGNGGGTGIGLIEVYDLDTAAASKLSNIATRGFVGSTPGDAIIAGFILGNQQLPDRVVIRGLGPSLSAQGVPNTLQNPTLELHNGDGVLLFTNNDWQDNPTNAAEVAAAGLAPTDTRESAIAITLPPGAYTAILAGLGGTTGNGLVEIYDRGAGP